MRFALEGQPEFPAIAAQGIPVILQPAGRAEVSPSDYLEGLRRLSEELILPDPFWQAYQLRVLPQLHRLLWGEKRGV